MIRTRDRMICTIVHNNPSFVTGQTLCVNGGMTPW
jgi:hypothetical protein